MAKMRAAQITGPNRPIEIVEREIPEPGHGEVRIRVEACGVCHSDSFTKEGTLPGIQYPRVPGHEVAGIIDAIGPGIAGWTLGQRAGIGWHGGHCCYCDSCRRGDFDRARDPRLRRPFEVARICGRGTRRVATIERLAILYTLWFYV